MHLVFLLEEPSAKTVLDLLLPRLLPDEVSFQTVPHWYFGDLPAVEKAYPNCNATKWENTKKYRIADKITKPADELKRLIPAFQKGEAARKIPQYMNIKANRSKSFQVFVQGIVKLCKGFGKK